MANKISPEDLPKYQKGYGWEPGMLVVRMIQSRTIPQINAGCIGELCSRHPTAHDYWIVSYFGGPSCSETVNIHELRLVDMVPHGDENDWDC